MGVPAFFRWLSRKYPSVIVECVENKSDDGSGTWVPEDATLPNPNGIEFDNLYLDMNGIIHPCTHPEDKPPPRNEEEMMVAIFECIDRLFNIVRPRKVLYMAIDGVAPRAKMNQQRSRRFRASKETHEKQQEIARIREKLIAAGCAVPPEKPKGEHFDSNCITPGTPFMERLSRALHYYIHDRLNTNPAWKNVKVFLSDANVPGEGEHKIMDYIRKQRAQPDHDPNTQHVLCGADADLMMLGLATHEPNFTIIREEFLPNKPRPCEICGQVGHEMDKCEGLTSGTGRPDVVVGNEVQFVFVRLCVLKEYLRKTLAMPGLPFAYDFERVVDDWVFMCFFVGNDFLPHLPSLEIRENAIDRLIELYKKCVFKTGGYLTNSGEVDLDRVQMILHDLGFAEDDIFRQRQKRELQFRARDKANKRFRGESGNGQHQNHRALEDSPFGPQAVGGSGSVVTSGTIIENAKLEMQKVRMGLGAGGAAKRKAEEEEEDPQANDEVRLWEAGFKDRYYESKFDVGADNVQFRYAVALQYVKGLCWVLKYYYQGCASWDWYFPYHYAPFASDFCNISGLSTQFERGSKPFNPMEQLMGVFPAASNSHVPAAWADLMSEPDSPIIDFYPLDFKIDLNGKKFAWQGVALLPFVDERRLIKAVQPLYDQLSDEEKKRNTRGDDRMYLSQSNAGYAELVDFYKKKNDAAVDDAEPLEVSIEGVRGLVLPASENVKKGGRLQTPISGQGLPDVIDNRVVTVRYRDPVYAEGYIFEAKRLKGAIDPPTVLAPDNRPDNYRAQVGFTRNVPQASLGAAGHRMMSHHHGGGGGGGGGHGGGNRNYSSIAPPQQYRGNDGGHQSHHHQNSHQQRNHPYQRPVGHGGHSSQMQHGGGGGGGGGQWQQNNNRGGGNFHRGGGGRGGGGGGQSWQQNRGGGRGGYNNFNQRGNSRGGGGGGGGGGGAGYWH